MMATGPIHIVGVTQRSGTNYLRDLLALHPATVLPPRVHEDYFPSGASSLLAGIDQIARRYPDSWAGGGLGPRTELVRHVELALQAFLRGDGPANRRLLTKSPGAVGLGSLVELLPGASVLALVRDGRDVTASGMKGLGWSFEDGLARWRRGAREILSVIGPPDPTKALVRLVRYEDLIRDARGELEGILRFVGLDETDFPWDAAHALPVSGSSFVRGDQAEVHWQGVDRPADFRPIGRAEQWPESLKARFALGAGRELQALGYDVPTFAPRISVVARLRELVVALRRR